MDGSTTFGFANRSLSRFHIRVKPCFGFDALAFLILFAWFADEVPPSHRISRFISSLGERPSSLTAFLKDVFQEEKVLCIVVKQMCFWDKVFLSKYLSKLRTSVYIGRYRMCCMLVVQSVYVPLDTIREILLWVLCTDIAEGLEVYLRCWLPIQLSCYTSVLDRGVVLTGFMCHSLL